MNKQKTKENTPVWLINPIVEDENKIHNELHQQLHVNPRRAQGLRYLDFDGKCDWDVFCAVRDELTKKWDKKIQ